MVIIDVTESSYIYNFLKKIRDLCKINSHMLIKPAVF